MGKYLSYFPNMGRKAYPDGNLLPVASVDTHAAESSLEHTLFDQDKTCRAEKLRSA